MYFASTFSIQRHQPNMEMRWFNSTGQMMSKLSAQLNVDTGLMELN
jgi:hypothetical protein